MIRCSISLGHNRLHLLLSYILATIFYVSISPSVHAQTYQPPVVFSSLNVFIDGQGLYFLGGSTVPGSGLASPIPMSLSFMMDLSVSWNASSPVFKKLPDGPIAATMPSTLSSDSQNWLAIVNGTAYVYNFKSAAWSSIITSYNIGGTGVDLSAVTDPETGLVYIPNGYANGTNPVSMLRVNLTAQTYDSLPMFSGSVSNLTLYSAAWSTPLRSMIVIEGSMDIFLYNPSTGWSNPTAKGIIPPARDSACLVPANGGSKMILFGGYSEIEHSSLSDIYFLDVATLTWTNGPNVTLANKRDSAACAVSNNNFIVWGGSNSGVEDVLTSSAALVYDLKANIWTSSYVAPPAPTTILNTSIPTASSSAPSNTSDIPAPTTATAKNPPTSAGGSPTIIIVGTIIGVVLVVLIGLGLALFRARSKKVFPLSNPQNDSYFTSTSFGRDFMPPSRNLAYPQPPPPIFMEDHRYDDRGPSSGRVQENYYGSRPRSHHPQAILEGVYGAQHASQHPHAHLGMWWGQDSSLGASHYLQPFTQHPDSDKDGLIENDGYLDAYYELQSAQSHVNIRQPRVDDSAYHIPKSQFQRRAYD